MGVALFALALIWLIALMTHEPTDPVWFFTTEDASSPANFVGRVGAFLSEVSFQLFGYAAYLLPGAVGVVGWHYFWCQTPQAAYTKAFGATLLLACASAFFSLVLGTAELAATTFDAGGSVGAGLGTVLTDYLNRTGSIIVLLTHDDAVGDPRDAVFVRPHVRDGVVGVAQPVDAWAGAGAWLRGSAAA